ncbi:oxygen-insensitive NADPH nitroreductase [Bacillus spongiae]|uniref:Oxygen-insensitive NADPH nitroreductase n=1 Tax=Bacillus spongiae TaxID=2683610 RepID=A0ABU8HAL0_9BACI
MNSTIETILHHRSIRKFTNEKLTKEQISLLVRSAQAASTSSYVQAYSIIGVTDTGKRKMLAKLAGEQSYVEESGHFFVFCADLYRHEKMGEWKQEDVTESLESTEKFLVATIDAALAAQNMSIAAESLGLGICYIGGIRNHLAEVDKILGLPKRVIPLFGLCVGYPDHTSSHKQRLPEEHIYHENVYEIEEQVMKQQIAEYDEKISAYYEKRTNGRRKAGWSDQMVSMLAVPKRMDVKEYLLKKGYNKK